MSQRILIAHVPVEVLAMLSARVCLNVIPDISLKNFRLFLVPLGQVAVLVIVDVRGDACIASVIWASIIQIRVIFGMMCIAISIALVNDARFLRVADVFALIHADVIVGKVVLVVWHDVRDVTKVFI